MACILSETSTGLLCSVSCSNKTGVYESTEQVMEGLQNSKQRYLNQKHVRYSPGSFPIPLSFVMSLANAIRTKEIRDQTKRMQHSEGSINRRTIPTLEFKSGLTYPRRC